MSKLYIIATPLGNRNDITFRATEILKQISHIFAEDTREARKLFEMLSIEQKNKYFYSYASHNMKRATDEAIKLLNSNIDIALISDRGTPNISDPGTYLVSVAWENGFKVVAIPGPSAVSAAISICGFRGDEFLFLGFLPKKEEALKKVFHQVQTLNITTCFFESPFRIIPTLKKMKEFFPNGEIFIMRELTKIFETVLRFHLSKLENYNLVPKGEFTIVLKPNSQKPLADLDSEISLRLMNDRDWAKEIAKRYQIKTSDVYNKLQKTKKTS